MLTIEVPTRAGVILRGLHYPPASTPAPTVLNLTPYSADRLHHDGKLFASRGFHFVSLDVRGRGDSDGRFTPFVFDGTDGHDAVEWLSGRPWSDGDVVTYGGSYCGYVQWAIAATGPAHLRAMAPAASVYPGVDFPMVGNIPTRYAVRWLALTDGHRMNLARHADEPLWRQASLDLSRPFRDLDLKTLGRRLPVFQEWLDHPELDDYWARLVPTPRQYAEITIPVLTITGHHDDDQLGALRFHDEHTAALPPDAVSRHQVLIGPWDHAGTRTAMRRFGGLTFAETSEIDLPALHADWYDWVLGRGDRPSFLTERVTYFHVGEDRWRSSRSIPAGQESLRLYPPAAELAIDPRRAAGEDREQPEDATCFTMSWPPPDKKTISYVGEPLSEAVDISGRFRANLTLSSDLPDFDLLVGVYLLRGDEPAILLGETVTRARYRTSLARPLKWPAGDKVQVELTAFPFVSFRAEKADRFALVIRPPHRHYQINFQAGGTTATETAQIAIPGKVRLAQTHEHQSYICLPLAT